MSKRPKHLRTSTFLAAVALGAAPLALSTPAPGQTPAPVVAAPAHYAATVAGFSPLSATYVSASQGWALGTVPCTKGRCTALLHTTDNGGSWSSVPVPPTGPAGTDGVPLRARFADSLDGWLFSTLPGQGPQEAWATHDGGLHWSKLVFATAKGDGPAGIEDIEAAHGSVTAAVQVGDQVDIFSSPVARNDWHRAGGPFELGAGPVPAGQLAVQGGAGWFVQNDRVVVSGGSKRPSGRWASWAPPCSKAGGPVALAAPTPTRVDALCTEGEWTGTKITIDLLTSTDGGRTFGAARRLPVAAADVLAAIGTSTLAVGADITASAAGAVSLEMSFDNGASWRSVYRHVGGGWLELGFTTLDQGVAIFQGPNGGANTMLSTSDGGRHWAPVAFRGPPS